MITMNGKVIAGAVILVLSFSITLLPFAGNIKEFYAPVAYEKKQFLQEENTYGIQWEKDYGKISWWSARYE